MPITRPITRDDLFALGCHLDDYDRRIAAGEDPEAAVRATLDEHARRQDAQRAQDAARDAGTAPSGVVTRVEQTEPAVAQITAPGSRRGRKR